MDNRLLNTQATKIAGWLRSNGYDSLVEWGLDSNYCMDDDGVWYDESGNEISIFQSAYYAMEAASYDS